MTTKIAMVALALMACGGGGGGTADSAVVQKCSRPTGLYHSEWTRVSGDCYTADPGLVNMDDPHPMNGRVRPECTGTVRTSADECEFMVDETCAFGAPLGTHTIRMAIRWRPDGSGAQGTAFHTRLSQSGLCSADYMIVLRRP